MRLEVHLVVPGPITRISGGTIYDRRLIEGLEALGHRVVLHELEGSFPLADQVARRAAADTLPLMRSADRVVIDGLALPAFEPCLDRLAAAWIALVHHPLALETGLPTAVAGALERREREMLATAARVVVTGPSTAVDIRRLGISAGRIGVVVPGTDPRPLAPADGDPPTLLSVGALIPRKAHELLLEALEGLLDLAWRLVLIGPTGRAPVYEEKVGQLVRRAGLAERVRLEGEVGADRLARAYRSADLFVLPSYHEGYGMALAEALAHGLPIVATRAGAILDTVPEGAGMLVPPGDPAALREALRCLIGEVSVRLRLRDGARLARRHLPRWEDQAAGFADQLAAVGG